MFVAVAIAFPVLLLLATLGMERVERPLERFAVRTELERFLASDIADVPPDMVEQFVAEGYRTTLSRYWRRADGRSATRARATCGAPRLPIAAPSRRRQ